MYDLNLRSLTLETRYVARWSLTTILLVSVALCCSCWLLFQGPSWPEHGPRFYPPGRLLISEKDNFCLPSQLSNGTWEAIEIKHTTWDQLKESAGYRCSDAGRKALQCVTEDSAARKAQLDRVSAANSWHWKPRGCKLRTWNDTALVDRLRRGTGISLKTRGLLFVGDSLQHQQAQSFECLLGRHVDSGNFEDKGAGRLILSETVPIESVRNDFIVQPDTWKLLLRGPEPSPLPANAEKWTHLVEGKEFVVVNTGAHWANIANNTVTARFRTMTETVAQFIDKYPGTTLIVRSFVPGHTHCEMDTAPMSASATDRHKAYNWAHYRVMNDIWKTTLRQYPRHIFLDVEATRLRPDGHRAPGRDCLHYCLPGPVDWWNYFLAHVILGV